MTKKLSKQIPNGIKEYFHRETILKINSQKTELLNQEEVVRTILSKQDENITFIYDAGQTPTYFTVDSKPQRHSQLLFSGGYGPMGYSIPASIGASFARENDVIIACPGDGSAQMTIEELAVINTYKLPIIIVIIDNQLLGIIKQWQDMAEYPNYQVKLENPDFVQLAHAYNIKADEVTTIQQLSDKLDEAIKNKRPYLIHLNVADQHIPLPNKD
jgi:acetolactate synthase-1/2/3 large subunit